MRTEAALGQKQTCAAQLGVSAMGQLADIRKRCPQQEDRLAAVSPKSNK